MSILYLFVLVVLAVFCICAFVGFIRFLIDVRKFSSYKMELDNLKEKYESKLQKLEDDLKEAESYGDV